MSDNNNIDGDAADNLATTEQPESKDMLSQETVDTKKWCAKNIMSANTEDGLIEGIRETRCLYQKGLRAGVDVVYWR